MTEKVEKLRMILGELIPGAIWRLMIYNRWVRNYKNKRKISYTKIEKKEFYDTLSRLGIKEGDTVLVHSAFDKLRGIDGGVIGIVDTLLEIVGKDGTILMPTFPRGTMNDAVRHKTFDVKWTPSEMGLITEVFRRLPGVCRSLHPYHSFAAKGKLAEWMTAGHENSTLPFGKDTPLGRLVEVDGKVLVLGVSLQWGLTVVHVVEDMMGAQFPVQVYLKKPVEVEIIDGDGNKQTMTTMVHNDEVYKYMNISKVEKYFWEKGIIKAHVLGGVRVQVLKAKGVVTTLAELAEKGVTIYSVAKR